MARAMKETKKLWSLWKESVQWDKKTMREKLLSAWFGISLILLGISGGWFIAVSFVNFVASAYYVSKYVQIDE